MHLAELNIGRARGEADDPVMHGFTSRLDAINTLADPMMAQTDNTRNV